MTAALAQPEGSSFNFDPDDEMWPTHTPIEPASHNHSGFTFLANHQFTNAVVDLSPSGSLIKPESLSNGSMNSLTQSEIEGMESAEDIEQLGLEEAEEAL